MTGALRFLEVERADALEQGRFFRCVEESRYEHQSVGKVLLVVEKSRLGHRIN